jgi:hypothetical protein
MQLSGSFRTHPLFKKKKATSPLTDTGKKFENNFDPIGTPLVYPADDNVEMLCIPFHFKAVFSHTQLTYNFGLYYARCS